MGVAVVDRAKSLYKAYWTPGQVLRPTSQVELRWIYGAWLLAFCAKVLGSSWDVTWHFKWLRDNLAPPHLINSAGTALVIALVVFHTFTGYGVDRVALRWMQAGIGVFILAVPIDIANHEINGLDLSAWSPSHMMLYVGTAIMIVGVLRGWWVLSEPGRWRVPVALALFFFSFENILFPNTQQDYGILSLQAWERATPYAEPILLQFAADQLGRDVDRTAVLNFTLPIPDWVHPLWIAVAGMFVLLVARKLTGFRWAATTIAAAYLLYRSVMWPIFVAMDFPPSVIPYFLLAGAVLLDVVCLLRLPYVVEAVVGAAVVVAGTYAAGWLQGELAIIPPWDYWSAPFAFAALAVLWAGTEAFMRRAARRTNSS